MLDRYRRAWATSPSQRETPRISVIMPCRNVEPFLQQAVESVLGQRVGAIEVIAINDGSTDSTGRMLDDFARWDRRITVLHQEQSGLGRDLQSRTRPGEGRIHRLRRAGRLGRPRRASSPSMRQADRVRCDIVKGTSSSSKGRRSTGTSSTATSGYRRSAGSRTLRSRPTATSGSGRGLYRREFPESARNPVSGAARGPATSTPASCGSRTSWRSRSASSIAASTTTASIPRRRSPRPPSSKNWRLLIRNYDVAMDFLVAKGVVPLYADNMLHVLYLAVAHMLALLSRISTAN